MSKKPTPPIRGHYPRVYDVPGEPLAIKIWTGTEDVWYAVTWPEARSLYDDLHDAVMRRMRAVESGSAKPCGAVRPD